MSFGRWISSEAMYNTVRLCIERHLQWGYVHWYIGFWNASDKDAFIIAPRLLDEAV